MGNWKKYKNGNYSVMINLDDGTKIRHTDANEFIPDFAESCDVQISNRCNNGCAFCYAGCTPDGKEGELKDWSFFDSLHPYTEMAINMNFPLPNDFLDFLSMLKKKNIIVNATVNQNHFEKNEKFISNLIRDKLIYGLGVSLVNSTPDFVERISKYKNAVIHTINGILTPDDIDRLQNHNLKILILGYKNKGRGIDYRSAFNSDIKSNQKWLYDNINNLIDGFDVISFDNLALNQLDIKRFLTDGEWEEFYMGDESSSTFFINLVDGTYSPSSLDILSYPIGDLTIDEMFHNVKGKSALKQF